MDPAGTKEIIFEIKEILKLKNENLQKTIKDEKKVEEVSLNSFNLPRPKATRSFSISISSGDDKPKKSKSKSKSTPHPMGKNYSDKA